MLIKEVCKITGLTPRTIRFYIEKGLINPKTTPKSTNEYREYSEEDVKDLINISLLRKLMFSLQDIKDMLEKPKEIESIINKHKNEVEKEFQIQKEILDCLNTLDISSITSVEALTYRIQGEARKLSLPAADVTPNFGKFDTETPEEKERAYLDFKIHQRLRERMDTFLRPVKKTFLIATIITIVFFAIVAISGIPKEIDKQYTAVMYRENEVGKIDKTSITVKGKLYKKLFSDTRFIGKIVISRFGYTKNYELCDVIFHKAVKDGYGSLIYDTTMNGAPKLETLGLIWIEGDFEKLTILVGEPILSENKSYKNLIISAPAETKEEAIKITLATRSKGK